MTTATTTKPTAKQIFAQKKSEFEKCRKEYRKLKEMGQLKELDTYYYKQNGGEYSGCNPRLLYMQGAKGGVYVPLHYTYDYKKVPMKKKDGTPYVWNKKVYKYDFDFAKVQMVVVPKIREEKDDKGEVIDSEVYGVRPGLVIHEDDLTPKQTQNEQKIIVAQPSHGQESLPL